MNKPVRANWSNAVLVCAKCSKKIDGGFGKKGRQSLAKALRRHLGIGKGRKSPLGIVEVKCLGICPRRAVTVLNAAKPDQWLLVEPGTALDEVAAALELDAP
ncbi:hypothetical protein [Sphingosinithalassobacter portus]|uniref:hypothetical protein n=1 Tax=Stakelama portus TaxID=2676234 RepID=UPI000D6DF844|nr:hypothetical protein [Sphingosinithalassobacter portus]